MLTAVTARGTTSQKNSKKSGTHRNKNQWPPTMPLLSLNGVPLKPIRLRGLVIKLHPPVGTLMVSSLKEGQKINCRFCKCLISAAKLKVKMVKTIVLRGLLRKFGNHRLQLVAVQRIEEAIRMGIKEAQIRSR